MRAVLLIIILLPAGYLYGEMNDFKKVNNYKIFGTGAISCEAYNTYGGRENNGLMLALKTWSAGYFSAYNSLLKEHNIQFLQDNHEKMLNQIVSRCSLIECKDCLIGEIIDDFLRESVRSIVQSRKNNRDK